MTTTLDSAVARSGSVVLRPATASDCDGVRAFLAGLSPASSFARFFTGLGNPSPALVRKLVEPGPSRGLWLATAACEPADAILGHASWVLADDGDAEISVVVADASHGLRIGHDLVEAVLAEARATGAPMLRMDVLASNRRVIGMISRRWPGWPPERDGTQLTYRVPLG